MSEVKVKFYASLKEKIGKNEITINADNMHELIKVLKDKLGNNFSTWVIGEDGYIKDYYILILNDRIIGKKDFPTVQLKEKDVVHIFPPVAGG